MVYPGTRMLITKESCVFNTLVVPLDGSALAERALPYAVRLAAERGGRLVLMRAALAPPPSGLDWERQQLAAIDEATAYLAGVAQKVATRVPVTTAPVYGHAPDAILDTVQQFGADSIVMATHGRTGLAHLLHGSVAEAVLTRSSVPVFMVYARPGEAAAAPFDSASARIMVPLDGSAFAEAALPAALEVVGAAGELVLTSVAAAPDHVERDEQGHVRAYLDQQEEAIRRETFDYLRQVQTRLTQQRPNLQVSLDVRIGDPAQGIATAEIDRAADLVVMATHGRTGIRRAVLGSVASAVLTMGSVPVLLVSPAASAAIEHQPTPGGMVVTR
jgi:nucleotide-binding universal stress UspA family protein